jgi:hypothetical protein
MTERKEWSKGHFFYKREAEFCTFLLFLLRFDEGGDGDIIFCFWFVLCRVFKQEKFLPREFGFVLSRARGAEGSEGASEKALCIEKTLH